MKGILDKTEQMAMNMLEGKINEKRNKEKVDKPLSVDSVEVDDLLDLAINEEPFIEMIGGGLIKLEDLSVFTYMALKKVWPDDKELDDESGMLMPMIWAYASIHKNNKPLWKVNKTQFLDNVESFSMTVKFSSKTIGSLITFATAMAKNFRG